MSNRNPHLDLPPGHPSCTVSTQALCFGPIETSVFAVAGTSARPGERAHVGLKFGRVLIYLEDRAAVDSLTRAVSQAVEMAGAVFGPTQDAFTEAEARARQRFERTGEAAALR
jgi:hypothetical protein